MDFLSREVGEFLSGSLAGVVTKAVLAPFETIRYGYNRRWSEDEKGMGNNFTRTQIRAHKKRRLSFLPQACFALVTTRNSTLTNFYQEVIEAARERFTREISFQSKDKDISLAKVILFLVCYFCFELMMVSRRMIANPTYFLFVL
ncbi:uncharacterized protein LOC114269200 isoform X4 [Camellia sinensis]|uniref:uncharacterized protein LOC114269200 isoform X4 n=1 Tax=Camellia sinensis TaxID=4442 RepID=UPI00103684F2|nr:uncharacterized protein LOC114269200 isoform X4 [Camellia sinensis]